MKSILTISLLLISFWGYCQKSDTVKHDTVIYVIAYDTTPMRILYYGPFGIMKYKKGFTIRQKKVNWQHPEQQEVIWQRLYDRHYALYTKEFYQANQAAKK